MFKGSEVINFAIEIEKNGREFYTLAANSLKEESAKETFLQLAAQENKHIYNFEQLLSTVTHYQVPEDYEGEYEIHLKALVDQHVFKQGVEVHKLLEGIDHARGAIELALSFEKDSILFFREMSKMVSNDDLNTINALIAEEHNHIITLAELKKQFSE